MVDAFYFREDGIYHSTVHTRGPWDENAQHGGPPSALLLRALRECVRHEAGEDFAVARLTTEFLRPVPIAPLRVEAQILRAGRTVVRAAATLTAEREVMQATALFIRRDPEIAPPTIRPEGYEEEVWPAPEDNEPFIFPFFAWEEGYHRAVEVRLVDPPWGTTPIRVWAQPVKPLIEGEETAPEEAVAIVADAESGMGPPLDPFQFMYPNPDLTVYFARLPRPGPIGMAIRSQAGDGGAALAEASLRDADGVFGRSAQSLLVIPR